MSRANSPFTASAPARPIFGVLCALGLAWAPTAAAQEPLFLSLDEARARAVEAGVGVRLAEAASRGASGRATQALAGFLPQIELRESFLRSTDPVAAFGFKLRQEAFGPADFDPGTLNDPSPKNDFETLLEVRQPVFQPEAWLGYRSARQAAGAAAASARRAEADVRHATLAAYFGARLAAAKAELLRQAERTAREHAERAHAMAQEGLVTESDAQLARVRALEVESDRIAAEADERIALDGLRRLLALPEGRSLVLTDTLAAPELRTAAPEPLIEAALRTRSDVEAAELQARAAASAISAARASFLPSAAVFGQVAWNDPGSFFGNRSDRWTVGLLFTWSPFQGAQRLGKIGEAAANRDAAAARLEDLRRAVAAEVRAALWRVQSAHHRLAAAEAAASQAEEALRIVRLRYENELIPVTELLDAETRLTEARLRRLAVRYEASLADSALERAAGAAVE